MSWHRVGGRGAHTERTTKQGRVYISSGARIRDTSGTTAQEEQRTKYNSYHAANQFRGARSRRRGIRRARARPRRAPTIRLSTARERRAQGVLPRRQWHPPRAQLHWRREAQFPPSAGRDSGDTVSGGGVVLPRPPLLERPADTHATAPTASLAPAASRRHHTPGPRGAPRTGGRA